METIGYKRHKDLKHCCLMPWLIEMVDANGIKYWQAQCPECNKRGPAKVNKDTAVDCWNKG